MHVFLSALIAVLAGPVGGTLLFVVLLVFLGVFAVLCREASAYLAERGHASRVARLMDTLASQADGIVGVLRAHPPASEATLRAVRDAAIAQSVAYAKTNLPDTLTAIGVPDGVLAARLANEVAGKLLRLLASSDASASSGALADGAVAPALAAVVPQPAATPAS